jgi:hypothetical protein
MRLKSTSHSTSALNLDNDPKGQFISPVGKDCTLEKEMEGLPFPKTGPSGSKLVHKHVQA